jgi:hypothetical protein
MIHWRMLPAQMQYQIAYCIFMCGLAFPHLLVIEFEQACFNAISHIAQLVNGIGEK